MIGTLLQNRYRLDAELGHGSMGTVYRAHDTLLDRDVAVKVLNNSDLGTEGRARLLREAQAVAGLDATTLDRSLSAGTWTIRQLVHHIVDGDDVWSIGIKAAIGNPDGVFTLQWYWDVPQTTWADKWRYADRDVSPSLELFRANRRHIAQLLEIVPEAWDRAITIGERGRKDERASVAEIVKMQARHALGHVQEIEQILSMEV